MTKRRKLPPLNALRAFEAAARHASFTKGAAELYVTQAAVSHQIKALEEHLGTKLFRRLDRGLELTDQGAAYYAVLNEVFDRIDEATTRLARADARETLTVTTLPSFAVRWLVPRLGRFSEAHPGIDVHLCPALRVVDLVKEGVDVAIRYGRGVYPGMRSDRLLDDEVFPVCSPALLSGRTPLRTPADLVHHVLLHDESHADWQTWLLAMGVEGVDATRGPVFVDSSMLLQAAAAGQGVALGRRVLAKTELEDGRLVRPFSVSQPADHAYYVVCPTAVADRPKVAAFRDWALNEARREMPAEVGVASRATHTRADSTARLRRMR